MKTKFIHVVMGILCLTLMSFGTTQLIAAQAETTQSPPQAAEQIRQRLFSAQVALLGSDSAGAYAALDEAFNLYETQLQGTVTRFAPQINTRILDGLETANNLITDANAAGFAIQRGKIWTSMLDASLNVVHQSLLDGDTTTAGLWLPLREFRPTTRFARPSTDATLAIRAVANGTLDGTAAWAIIRGELLDTYQFQMNNALSAADEAQQNGFALRRAEEIGLATGYFSVLSGTYGDQYGEETLTEAQTTFESLSLAAQSSDEVAYSTAWYQVDTVLTGFQAVPLSEEDLARRAGQFTRYLSLVPVEYGRGVRNGAVINDIEIQEALTFYAGATAAFADLEVALSQTDAQITAEIDTALANIQEQLRSVVEPNELEATVARIENLANEVIPADWLTGNTSSDVDVVLTVLDQVVTAAAAGDYQAAESARLEAYALLELGLEQRLVGFAPDMANRIESLFWQGTSKQPGLSVLLSSKAPVSEVRTAYTALANALNEANLLLSAGKSAPGAVVGNAAVIVFREGLEAVLILASLLASLRAADQRRYRRPLLIGAVFAFGATVVTWWFAVRLLNVLLPLGERLEAIVSIIAIGVLLLITNWFFHKAYWTGWMANFHARKRKLVGGMVAITIGQSIGLILLGFTSIYREGFETVLFLQSLVLEAGTAVVLEGVALGLLGTAGVGVLTFGLQMRLPYKKMLIVTGVMISAVLVIMVGNTVHTMQSVGWMPITPINGVYFPFWMGQWFGFFATWQGIILQIVAGTFVIGSYFLAENQNKRNRVKAQDKHPVQQVTAS